MSDALSLPASSPDNERYAQVWAGGRVTRYVRRGAGHPVLVLDARTEGVLCPALVTALGERHRVILPETPDVDADWIAWLRGFLDGVCCAPVTLLAAGEFCLAALELALLDGDRLAGLVLVPRGCGEETGIAGALATRGRATALPVLVVRRQCPLAEAVGLVERFVAGV